MMYNNDTHTHSSYHHTHVMHTHYTQYVSSHYQAGYYSNIVYTVIFKEHQFLYGNFTVCEIFILKIRKQIKLENKITKFPPSCHP